MEAHRLGSLPGLAGDLVLGARSAISVEEMAERSGVPVERVERVLLANGLSVSDDTMLPSGLVGLMASFEQGAAILGDEAILAFSRALGAAATNIAEAAVALFYAELGPGTEREGTTELARAQVAEAATLAFTNVPDVLSRLLLAQFDRASRRAAAARGWSEPGAGAGGADGPGEVVALGFVDLVGSTSWAEGLSLRDQSLALSRFESAAWSSAVRAGGRVVKMIGDEVFFAAPTADTACRIGLEVCRAAALDPLLPPGRGAVGLGLVTPRRVTTSAPWSIRSRAWSRWRRPTAWWSPRPRRRPCRRANGSLRNSPRSGCGAWGSPCGSLPPAPATLRRRSRPGERVGTPVAPRRFRPCGGRAQPISTMIVKKAQGR